MTVIYALCVKRLLFLQMWSFEEEHEAVEEEEALILVYQAFCEIQTSFDIKVIGCYRNASSPTRNLAYCRSQIN